MNIQSRAARSRLFACAAAFLLTTVARPQTPSKPAAGKDEFVDSIRPVLAQNCSACHNPNNPKNRINFLKANIAQDLESNRGLWRNVAAQLRNRTMPPVETKLTEDERLRVATWIDDRLRQTACAVGDYAGAVALRRLNRREYHNTIRDLLGVDYNVAELFPNDGTGGSGFDTNGETLFIPPLLMERYMEAAQQILDRAIVTPDLMKTLTAAELSPVEPASTNPRVLAPGKEVSTIVPVYLDGDYDVRVAVERQDGMGTLAVQVDGATGVPLAAQQGRGSFGGAGKAGGARGAARPPTLGVRVRLARGMRVLSLTAEGAPVSIASLTVQQKPSDPGPERLALHYRLLGMEPGVALLQPRKAAEQILRGFLRKAYRRPVETGDVTPLLTLYDRAAQRGDPFEERMKLALKAVLVGPDFLFKLEHRSEKPGIYPISQYELASRLSYFLWSTMPDDELNNLAAQDKLQDPKILTAQVERMLDDPKSRSFTSTFVGQWLGTQDVGGRVVPMLTELQTFYNPPVAADLRAEPILLFERILGENRSLLELLTADYTYMTERLFKFYQLEDRLPNIHGNEPQLVQWPDHRRGGVLNLGSVMAMTSHYRQTSPVLRGAWVLETLLGTPVPPPPPNVPVLAPVKCLENCAENGKTAAGMRQRILDHRVNPACSACHNLMDPIGFALENFDWTGRWRDRESDGSAIDATGALPSGEKFNGPEELRRTLLDRKEDFLRHLTGKLLGYALGRSLQDGDSCTVQRLADSLQQDHYRARTLIRDIALSIPFRNSQGGRIAIEAPPPPPKRATGPMVVK
jgi:mono/diheme cytochrome c family protein